LPGVGRFGGRDPIGDVLKFPSFTYNIYDIYDNNTLIKSNLDENVVDYYLYPSNPADYIDPFGLFIWKHTYYSDYPPRSPEVGKRYARIDCSKKCKETSEHCYGDVTEKSTTTTEGPFTFTSTYTTDWYYWNGVGKGWKLFHTSSGTKTYTAAKKHVVTYECKCDCVPPCTPNYSFILGLVTQHWYEL